LVLSRIILNKFGFSRLFEINCRSNRGETGTQIGQNRKNQKPHRTSKPKNRYYLVRKPKTRSLKTKNPQTAMNTKTEKPKNLLAQKPKKRSKQ